MTQIIPTAEPFLLEGDRTKPACLLIHGFTGSPKEMRWMGEYLNRHGYTCLGVRLAGHATHPDDMIRSHWTDWVASVENGYHILRGLSDRIYLAGLSMGGILSLLMSTWLEPRAQGVIAISTPYRLPAGSDFPVWFIRLASAFIKFRPKAGDPPGSTWFDQAAYLDHVSYPQNPVRSGAELKLLILQMHKALPNLNVPVLLMHSKDDTYIAPENAEWIYEALTHTTDKTKLYFTGSGHVLTRDAARQPVFQATLDFIQRIESSKG
jgi:carboxylesterase